MRKSSNNKLQCLKNINSIIVDNVEIKIIIEDIKKLAHSIHIQKRSQHIKKVMQLCLNSTEYKEILQKLTKLEIFQKNQLSRLTPFTFDKICFNQISGEQESYSIALIIIPQGKGFSLHDHPDMLVLTKILYGEIEVESMDIDQNYEKWQKSSILDQKSKIKTKTLNTFIKNSQRNEFNVLQMVYHNTLCDIWNQLQCYQNYLDKNSLQTKNWKKELLKKPHLGVITPFKSNIHSFVAKSDCIILDILLPDYLKEENCNYYEYINENTNQKNPMISKLPYSKQPYTLQDIGNYVFTGCDKKNKEQLQK